MIRSNREAEFVEGYIDAIPAVQVSVKPLEWVYDERRGVWDARDGFGRHYTVSDGQWFHGSLSEFTWVDGGDESAKTAAQADYEARIWSALTVQLGNEVIPSETANRFPRTLDTSPGVTAGAVPSPDVAALVEAAERMLDAFCVHEDSFQTAAYDAMCAALARLKGGAA